MTTWCKSLKTAIESDSRWKASIPFPCSNARSLNEAIYRKTCFGILSRSSSFSSISSSICKNEDNITTNSNNDRNNCSSIPHDNNDLSHFKNVILEHETLENNHLKISNINISNLLNIDNDYNRNTDDFSINSQSTNHSQSKFDTKSSVDIVEVMGDENTELSAILTSIAVVNSYPKNALFLFEGYEGKEAKNLLIDDIKKSAFQTGTVLSIHKTNTSNSKLSIVIGCNHYGAPKRTVTNRRKTFGPNCVQACDTIIQFAHDPPSVKNKSRNAFNKRTTSSSTTTEIDSNNSKIYRSSSKKCFCSFSFTISYCNLSQKWFLMRKKNTSCDNMYHNNHIWINPSHLNTPKKQLNEKAYACILKYAKQSISIRTIMHLVKEEYDCNVDYHTVFNIRLLQINNIIGNFVTNKSQSKINNLIAYFKQMNSVSFVYILHNYDSGFVTYRKKKKSKKTEKYLSNMTESQVSKFSQDTISNWRDSLTTSNKGDILVAFAWAHDEEVKAAEKYPEFLGVDVTFGVNIEQRALFLVAGMDGRNRAFTAFRCFIPSKQEHAYTWIVNEALSHLLSSDTLKHNQCVACDQELGINNAINTTVASEKPSLSHSKLRLDCFHFFNLVWSETVAMKKFDTEEASYCLDVMKKWIMSWFRVIETESEFFISLKEFKIYFKSIENIIGEVSALGVSCVLQKILAKRHYLLHYHFADVCTFDFLGDSIVEASNYNVKKGPQSVNAKMNIDTSAITLVNATITKFNRESLSAAKKLNVNSQWSNSLTKGYLTEYAEGLSCSVFDRRMNYLNKKINNNTWLVCHKYFFPQLSSCSKDNKKSIKTNPYEPITKFQRIRKVSIIEDNFMTCTCGYTQRWLMPCVHICSVIDDKKYLTAELFHIRWWKHFDYVYKKGNSSMDAKTRRSLENSLQEVRNFHFHLNNGKYKGVPLNGTELLKHLVSISPDNKDDYNIELDMMLALNKMRLLNIPLKKSSQSYIEYMTDQSVINQSIVQNCIQSNSNDLNDLNSIDSIKESVSFDIEDLDQLVDSFGVGSQVESNLSEFRKKIPEQKKVEYNQLKQDCIDNSVVNTNVKSFYTQLKPMFEEMVSSIKSQNDCDSCKDIMEKFTFSILNKKRKHSEIINTNLDVNKNDNTSLEQMSFLGEHINGEKKIEKRTPYKFERFKSNKKSKH